MPSALRTPPAGGAFSRRFTHYAGLFFDEFCTDSAWIREQGEVRLPPLEGVGALVIAGEVRAHPEAKGVETAPPGLEILVNGSVAAKLADLRPGSWQVQVPLPAQVGPEGLSVALRLTGNGLTNFLAWAGRVTGLKSLQRFRAQNKNRQLRVATISTDTGETIFDFAKRHAPFSIEFARRRAKLGLNVVGFLAADLGVGESARCMVRAADAAKLPVALVPLKLHTKNRLGDQTFAPRFVDEPVHAVNVVHIDAPAARDIDHHHGKSFRPGRYNIGYLAWELPEFPDAWTSCFDYFDEIWCPSEFTRASIALKAPLPVLAMPHSIIVPPPTEGTAALRKRFGLPMGQFLFLSLFDLNSYVGRKNPLGAIEAFRRSRLVSRGATLVVKVHNAAANPTEFAALREAISDLPGTVLISDTLDRADIYALEAACDCFVSLHRSEGFGLALAECMALGKPVIATDWSGSAEFLNATNACPVRCTLVALEQNHGPYAKGGTWAEPDVDHAAEWMVRLFSERGLAARIGLAARQSVERQLSPAVIGARYRRRLEAIACF